MSASELDAAIAEATDTTLTVPFMGQDFPLAEKSALMPMLRFAKAAAVGVDTNEMAGLAALYDVLKSLIADETWASFEALADETRADGDDLLPVVTAAIVAMSGRPTTRPSDSSAGPASTSAPSTPPSSSPVRPVSHIREMADKHGWDLTG